MRTQLIISGILVIVFVVVAAAVFAFATESDRTALLNTLALGTAVNLIAIPLGIAYAKLCLNSSWVSRSLRFAAVVFVFVPLFVHVSAWDSAFGKLGWLTNAMWLSDWQVAGISIAPWSMAVWIHSIAAVPQIALIIWLGLKASGRIYEEQAELDANSNSVFWCITLPRMLPLIGVCSLWLFVTCAREITVTDIYRIGTIAEQIYLGYSLGELDAVTNPLMTFAFLATVAAIVFAVPWTLRDEYLRSNDIKPSFSTLKKNSPYQTLLGLFLLLITIGVPAANLLARASRYVEMDQGAPTAKFSLQNAWRVVAQVPFEYSTEFQWSFVIALTSSVIIFCIAIPLVWASFSSQRLKYVLIFSVAVSCCLPGPFIGSSILWLRSATGTAITNWLFDRTIFGPTIANLVFCWPISCILFWFILKNTAVDAIENSRLEGAGSFTSLTKLAISGNWLALSGGFLITFANCFGELSSSQLAVPPGIDTIPRRMLGLLHSGVNDDTAGLTIVSLASIISIVSLGGFIVRWNSSQNQQ